MTVRHHVAGGREHGGGIGRLVGYVLDAPETTLRHRVVDPRGPRFHPLGSIWPLARAVGTIAGDAVSARPVLHHLHIAGRGSTVRKTLLAHVARALGQPYVMHLHDYDYAADLDRRPEWQRAAIRRAFGGAARVVVLGQGEAAMLIARLGLRPDRVCVLRNCAPEPSHSDEHSDGPVGILFLGRLGARKGVPELVAAFAAPAMSRPGWRAVLAGDGAVEETRAEVARLGLADLVTLPGWVGAEAAAALRSKADILVLPSHAEGFAMAVVEGLAQGLAVVTTGVGCHHELLTDGENCLLVPPGDVEALANALARLVADEVLRARLGRAGRALYERHFRLAPYMRALERLQFTALPEAAALPKSA